MVSGRDESRKSTVICRSRKNRSGTVKNKTDFVQTVM